MSSAALSKLRGKNEQLERMLAKMGSKADTPEFRDRMHRTRQEAHHLAQTTLRDAKMSRSMDAEDAKLFGNLLTNFQRINKRIEEKEQEIVQVMSHSAKDAAPLDSAREQAMLGDVDIQFQVYDVEQIQQRNENIKEIEKDVTELAEMFKDLQLLVEEQGEQLDTIEANVTHVNESVNMGVSELRTAEDYMSRRRKKQCFLFFLILVIIGAIIGIVVGVSRK